MNADTALLRLKASLDQLRAKKLAEMRRTRELLMQTIELQQERLALLEERIALEEERR